MNSTPKRRASRRVVKCSQCNKPAIFKYADKIPLCVDCYHKIAQADFMEQQTMHNKQSWLASQLNYTEQQLYVGYGGLLPLKQMTIPQPPSVGSSYTFSQIQVSDSNVGVINPGTLFTLNTSIEVMQNRGDSELAKAVKELTQAVLDDKQITNDLKKEIAEQLEFLVAEAVSDREKRRIGVIKGVMSHISKAISISAALLTIWDKVEPLFRITFGF
jgi:ribosomal protein L37AE/L43A